MATTIPLILQRIKLQIWICLCLNLLILINHDALSIIAIIIILFWCLLNRLIVLVRHRISYSQHVHAVYCQTAAVEYFVDQKY